MLPPTHYPKEVVGFVGGTTPLGPVPELVPELGFDPMLGQFFVEPDDEVPLELLDGVVLVEPEVFVEEPLPVDEPVPDAVVPVELVELVLDVLVAALATNAPPVTRPPVSAPIARTLRRWSFIFFVSFLVEGIFCFPMWGNTNHCATWTCGWDQRRVTAP